MKRALTGSCVALVAALVTSGIALATDTTAIVAPVKAAIEQINAGGNPAPINAYFTADAVIVDNFPPFKWSGHNAAVTWLLDLESYNKFARIRNMVVTLEHPSQISVDRDRAYVVVPLRITSSLASQQTKETGLWALTLERAGSVWKIASASWAQKP